MIQLRQIGLSAMMSADKRKQYIPKVLTSGSAPIVNRMAAYVKYMSVKKRHLGKIILPIFFGPMIDSQSYNKDNYGMNWIMWI